MGKSNTTVDDLFFLCRRKLYKDGPEKEKAYSFADPESLKKVIPENGLSVFLHSAIKEQEEKTHCFGDDYVAAIGALSTRKIVFELSKYRAIRKLTAEAEARGLRFVFFKGLIIADLYPQYAERISSDSDILVSDEQKEAAEQLLLDLGYVKNPDKSKKHVQVYNNPELHHIVELHTRLWEDFHGPKIDVLNSLHLSSESTDIRVNACGIDVNTLGYEQHLIFQIFHVIKHFSLEGIGIRSLIDITLFVNRYYGEIDFDAFWKHIDMLGYTKFTEAFFKICIDELNMTDVVFEGHTVQFKGKVTDLVQDLVSVGNIGDKEARWQIMGAMEAYFTGDAMAPETKIGRKFSMVFPSVDALPRCYGYAIKHPILLPVAWVHRGISFLIKKNSHKEEFYGVREKIDVAEHRLKLLDELGLSSEK